MDPLPSSGPGLLAVALTAALLLPATTGDAGGPDAGAPADPVQGWLAHARGCLQGKFSLQADFTHEVLHPLGNAQPAERGVVQLRRGGRLRLEYGAPSKRLLVSDGATIRAYDPHAKVVYESPAAGGLLPLAFGFALDPGRAERFDARWIGGAAAPAGDQPGVIELVPSAPDPLAAKVLLTLAPTCPAVERITVIDRAGVAVRITLARQRYNVGIGAARFRLPRLPGVEVVTP